MSRVAKPENVFQIMQIKEQDMKPSITRGDFLHQEKAIDVREKNLIGDKFINNIKIQTHPSNKEPDWFVFKKMSYMKYGTIIG